MRLRKCAVLIIFVLLSALVSLSINWTSNQSICEVDDNDCNFVNKISDVVANNLDTLSSLFTKKPNVPALDSPIVPQIIIHLYRINGPNRIFLSADSDDDGDYDLTFSDLFKFSTKFTVDIHDYGANPELETEIPRTFLRKIPLGHRYTWNSATNDQFADLVKKLKELKAACNEVIWEAWVNKFGFFGDACNDGAIVVDNIKNVFGFATGYNSSQEPGHMFMRGLTNDGFVIYDSSNYPYHAKKPRLNMRIIAHEFSHVFGLRDHGIKKYLMSQADFVREECVTIIGRIIDDGFGSCWTYNFRPENISYLSSDRVQWPGETHRYRILYAGSAYQMRSLSSYVSDIKKIETEKVEFVGEPVYFEYEVLANEGDCLTKDEALSFIRTSDIKVSIEETRTIDNPEVFYSLSNDNSYNDCVQSHKIAIPVFSDGDSWLLTEDDYQSGEPIQIDVDIFDKLRDREFKDLGDTLNLNIVPGSDSVIKNKLLQKIFLRQNPEILDPADFESKRNIKKILNNQDINQKLKRYTYVAFRDYSLQPKLQELLDPKLESERLQDIYDNKLIYNQQINIFPQIKLLQQYEVNFEKIENQIESYQDVKFRYRHHF